MGHTGDPNVHTPTMDTIAGEGMSFVNATAGCPWCTPFRGAMMTSRYVHHATQQTPQRLDPDLPTVADAFNDQGYHTAYFGKWHLDGSNKNDHRVPPERRGRFQQWEAFEAAGRHFGTTIHGTCGEQWMAGYQTDALTDRALTYLNDRAADGQPFFGVVSVTPPHDPYVAPRNFMRPYRAEDLALRPNVPAVERITDKARRDLAGYYGCIENLDWNLGRIRDKLIDTGLAENTTLIYFSDHGDCHGSHGAFLKSSPWEEALRIPCLMWGGSMPFRVDRRSDAPINHVDFAPTSLGLCGLPVPATMAGTDFSAHVTRFAGGAKPDIAHEPRSAYIQQCVRKPHGGCNDRTWRGVRTRDGWKYVCLEGQPLLMINLNEDPYEQANLAFLPEYRHQRAELTAEIQSWIDRTGDDFTLPEP